jgi:hypothetical protein
MTSKHNPAVKDRCQEPSTFVSGVGQSRAQAVATLQAALKSHIQAKYAISSRIHYLRPIDAILGGVREHTYIDFRFQEDFSSQKELMRRFYKRREAKEKVVQLCEYFKYHYEIPRIFTENFIHIIDGFHDRRRHQIYQKVKQLIGKENIVGDESNEEERRAAENQKQAGYSLVLKGLRLNAGRPQMKTFHPAPGDTLQRIVSQLGTGSHHNSVSELSVITTDNFKERQNSFLKFMHKTEPDEGPKEPSILKRSGSSGKQTQVQPEAPVSKEGIELVLKKQKKPTIVKVKPSLLKDSNGLKKLVGKALLEPKKSPRENMINGSRSKLVNGPIKPTVKTEPSEIKPQFKKSMVTINNFRKEIEDFHLAQSLSSRTSGLFKSFLEKGMLTTNKSSSPQLNLLTSTRAGLNSMNILNSEPSTKMKVKFLMNLSKDIKQVQKVATSPQASQKLLSVRSTGHLKEKSLDKSESTRTKQASNHDMNPPGAWMPQNRASFSNPNANPRDFVLIKRLKSEDKGSQEKATFERKLSTSSKFNLSTKKLSLGGNVSISKPKPEDKAIHLKQNSASKTTKSGVMGTSSQRNLSSFRSRSKIGSMNIN